MTKENYLNLKNELKETAQQIKSLKFTKKLSSQAYSNFSSFKKNVAMQNSKDIVSKWTTCMDAYNTLCKTIYQLTALSKEYRHKHIVYSMARGKEYSQIESKTRDNNKPDWSLIKTYMNQYKFDEVSEIVA